MAQVAKSIKLEMDVSKWLEEYAEQTKQYQSKIIDEALRMYRKKVERKKLKEGR